jgi:hypothetical protein
MFTMLHLKCFVFLGQGRGGGRDVSKKKKGTVANGGQRRDGCNSILFYSDAIFIRVARADGTGRRADAKITVFSPGVSHRARAPSRAPREPARLGGNTTGIDFT